MIGKLLRVCGKHLPWVLEAFLPALVIAFASILGLHFDLSGWLVSAIFIITFLILLLNNRRTRLRKLFVSVVILTIYSPNLAEAIKGVQSQFGIAESLLNMIGALLSAFSDKSEPYLLTITILCGLLALGELLAIDWVYSDNNPLKNRRKVRIVPKNTSSNGCWSFRVGHVQEVTGETTEIYSFNCWLNGSYQKGKEIFHIQDMFKNIRVSPRSWGSLPIKQYLVMFNNSLVAKNYSLHKFGRGAPTDMKITIDVSASEMPWFVKRFKPNTIRLSFEIIDDSGGKHYISGEFAKG